LPAIQSGVNNSNDPVVQGIGGVAEDHDDEYGAESNSAEVDSTRIAAMFILKTTEVHRVSQII